MYSHNTFGGAGGRRALLTHAVAKFFKRELPLTWFGVNWSSSSCGATCDFAVYQLMGKMTYQHYNGCTLTGIQTERSICIF